MKNLQMKYNLLHFFFFISYCAVLGFTAVLLQYKGMSNSLIGIVTGGGALASILISPWISSLPDKNPDITMRKLIVWILLYSMVSFCIIGFLPLPDVIIIGIYILLICVHGSIIPFLSAICMDYIKAGHNINFGLARGLGSVSYAISAVVIGRLVDLINPLVTVIVFLVSALLCLMMVKILPVTKESAPSGGEKAKGVSMPGLIRKYRTYFLILLGISLPFAAASALATYLINIVRHLGGSASLYGIVIFAMAFSEMPAMAITPRLMRRYSPETILAFAAGAYVVRNVIICLAPDIPILILGVLFQSVSYGFFTAVVAYYVARRLDRQDQIMGQTLAAVMTTGLGATIGNLAGGFLQDTLGLESMYVFSIVLSILGAVIVLVSVFADQKKKKETRA